MVLNFKIVDGDDYYSKYEQFIEYYNNPKYDINSIRKELELSSNKFRTYRKRALEEKRVSNRSQMESPKYYYKLKNGKYMITKCINGHPNHFGVYNTEEEAQNRVIELKKNGWETIKG